MDKVMISWREIDMTDEEQLSELNRAVALAAGWRIKLYEVHGNVNWYHVYSPKGESMTRHTAYSNVNEWPEYDMRMVVPDFSHDLNACVDVLNAIEMNPHTPSVRREWRLSMNQCELCSIRGDHVLVHQTGASTAMAACKAILTWHEMNIAPSGKE